MTQYQDGYHIYGRIGWPLEIAEREIGGGFGGSDFGAQIFQATPVPRPKDLLGEDGQIAFFSPLKFSVIGICTNLLVAITLLIVVSFGVEHFFRRREARAP